MDKKKTSSFVGAADIVAHAETAARHLKRLSIACSEGDKGEARQALRQAISELEVARALLRSGIE
ncbi:hypothetical protein QA639_09545 [Bradyrhizobium pachyrhizi]|uniref:hypothetical protein n=1 Tax=Bradyrhizobium TaxID=374 RepID=UPI00041D0ABF|nr:MULTISPECIES: hypothetical protein [Bradyrhizobium]WFU57726.1 hypothetical protein QA639_09545 [Bradyrhizobium pachyrhizi]WOH83267.1 hypothetical protein RX327_09075 [Bradyrhizobium sp. BEA-2-5]